MTFHVDTRGGHSRRAPSDVRQFRVLFAVTFMVMLVSTLFSRLALSRWGENTEAETHRSIFHEARARTDKIVPFMFMG
jgi:hypothetical protein